ncbi:PucR family transcriptional regulator [Wenjunlia tyrosinilytica]|uniref:PucR family transcriptional regulator n=1 Tax=Wenjunlia tyrosinilytica TaxID=1544741 RepID=A0A917ZQ79_9ACTN|nr:PucR family transcriptional regulator [Wenjunlia tyrosinilytica]GGO88766.1 PucR family transcriptional regulator [Wenjunlia tyrosinilytica]
MNEPPLSPSATLAVPLTWLLAREDLGLRQVAGTPAEDTSIAWVHTSEMDDPVPYLLGGELLLTAGVHFPATGDRHEYLDRYVARAVEAGAAALGFGVAPVHDTVPPELVAACDMHGLPLLEVPPPTSFVAVGRAVWLAISEARTRELRRMSEAQQGLATAAARRDPVPAVLRQLAHALTAWVVLFDREGRELHSAGVRPSDPVPARLASLAARLHGGRPLSTAADHTGDQHLTAHALAETGLVLGLAAGHQDAVDRSVSGVAAVLLSLLTGSRHSLSASGSAAALVRLLLGARPEDAAPLLGEGPWAVVRGRRRGRTTEAPELAAATLGTALGTPFVDVEGEELRALLPGDAAVAEQPGWTLGVSAPAPAADLTVAEGQAERALRRALANRAAVARHRPQDSGMASLVAPGEAAVLARARLSPLADAPELAETLRAWLSLHGSWDRTAVALEVHRNTVRQRIARVESLLDADLADADTRMELWFALRFLPANPGPGHGGK